MLEMDCVYNSVRGSLEVGETEDQMIAYFKAKQPISEIKEKLSALTGRFGLTFSVLAKKHDPNGNVIKVQFLYDGSWD
jgi:hypothetical protein